MGDVALHFFVIFYVVLLLSFIGRLSNAFVVERRQLLLESRKLKQQQQYASNNAIACLSSSGTTQRQRQRRRITEAVTDEALLRSVGRSTVALYATVRGGNRRRRSPSETAAIRKTLLSRKGPHFQLDRFNGQIEFGATATLVTQLVDPANRQSNNDDDHLQSISTWLQDERGLAMSIWDEKLTRDMGDAIYRLQIMTLQFVTLQLSPWVDVQMRTITEQDSGSPVFTVQSVDFDPNIQLGPGMRISAESLGIIIDVAGELRPSSDGLGVTGCISFQTSGNLPPPLRLVPDPVLRTASDTINQTIVNFAIQSFRRGATAKYKEFIARRKQQQEQQQ